MRIGLLLYNSLDTISGGYLYDRKLVEHLRQCGDEVEIISIPWWNYARHLTDNFSSKLIARLQTSRFDVLLQDELNHPSLFLINQRLRGRYPLISIVHHLRSSELRPAWQNVFYQWVERRYLRSVDGFVFNSETTRRAAKSLIGPVTMKYPERRVTVLLRRTKSKDAGSAEGAAGRYFGSVVAYPAGDRFHLALTPDDIRARAHQSPFRILFVGNVIPRKGLHTLVAATARLKTEEWRLEIVGELRTEAGYANRIREQIEGEGLRGNVFLRGALTEAELAETFARSHVLAVPSSYEGFGIVYLEGMGFGLPAIATGAGGAGEIITDGEDGFLIAPGDVEALADHLRRLMNDRERLMEMSLAAQRRFAIRPTWEESTERIRNFLHTL